MIWENADLGMFEMSKSLKLDFEWDAPGNRISLSEQSIKMPFKISKSQYFFRI